jgi:hypothetical protein
MVEQHPFKWRHLVVLQKIGEKCDGREAVLLQKRRCYGTSLSHNICNISFYRLCCKNSSQETTSEEAPLQVQLMPPLQTGWR